MENAKGPPQINAWQFLRDLLRNMVTDAATLFVFIPMEKWKHPRRRKVRMRSLLSCPVKSLSFAGTLSRVNSMLLRPLQRNEDGCKLKQFADIVILMESWLTMNTLTRGGMAEVDRSIFLSVRLVLMMGQTYRRRRVQKQTSFMR